MPIISREDATVEFADGDAELRAAQAGNMTVAFVRVPQGADFRPALQGLPGDMCQCPHWGYILKGRIRMHTPDGEEEYAAGDVVYWPPGHAPEALEDSEYIDFSPTERSVPSSTTSRASRSATSRATSRSRPELETWSIAPVAT